MRVRVIFEKLPRFIGTTGIRAEMTPMDEIYNCPTRLKEKVDDVATVIGFCFRKRKDRFEFGSTAKDFCTWKNRPTRRKLLKTCSGSFVLQYKFYNSDAVLNTDEKKPNSFPVRQKKEREKTGVFLPWIFCRKKKTQLQPLRATIYKIRGKNPLSPVCFYAPARYFWKRNNCM